MKYKIGEEVTIPTSELGNKYGIGKIKAVWSNRIAVDFSGHLGYYTISQHDIIPVDKA